MKKRASGYFQIEIRDKRLRGGRLSLSSRTGSLPTARKREAAIRMLLDSGETEAVERLRRGEVHIAEIEKAVASRDLDAIRPTIAEPLTVRGIVDRTLQTVEATLRPKTLHQYEIIGGQVIEEFGADRDPATVTKAEVETWLHRKRGGKPWAPKTQSQKAALAGRFWREAIEREAEVADISGVVPRITRNPFTGVELPEVRQTRFAYLQPEEWRTLIEDVRGKPVAITLGLGALAGLRMSEKLHLRPELDVDLDARKLRIQSRGGEHPWKPKSGRGERDIHIGSELHRLITEHMENGYSGSRYLITTPGKDRPVHPGTVTKWTRAAYEGVGLKYGREGEGLTDHSLRHTFASWLVQRDVQLMKVAKLLGDTVEQVAKTYAHLLPEDLDRAVELVDSIATEEEG